MYSKIKSMGHPIHPMLVTIPIGLWVCSLVCDFVRASGSGNPNWAVVALYTMERQPGGGWKIAGCILAPSTVKAA